MSLIAMRSVYELFLQIINLVQTLLLLLAN